jgi:hypothetical protein
MSLVVRVAEPGMSLRKNLGAGAAARLDWEILSVRRRGPGVIQLRDDHGLAPDIPCSATTSSNERSLRSLRRQIT